MSQTVVAERGGAQATDTAIRPFQDVPEAELTQPKLFSEEIRAGFRSLR